MSADLSPPLIIARKRDGFALTGAQIFSFVRGAVDGSWADYQLSAMLMAICLRGMNEEERVALTDAMMKSGTLADLGNVATFKVDKHSTGGVGDKISLHLAPMVAACGLAVPMISGRGLGHTGGTLDKLESIPGFRVGLNLEEYRRQVGELGLALIGQTAELAPADRKLYALRDVTATVESLPLICASIMCKKLAEGIDGLVLDVKFGRGAFMKTLSAARELAEAMVGIGNGMGKRTRALLTSMDEPLGHAVGNALEVAESIACLKGEGPDDLMEVTFALGEQMLLIGGAAKDATEARLLLERVIADGSALEKFRSMTEAQGGDSGVVDDPGRLPQARIKKIVTSDAGGFVNDVEPMAVALTALDLGAGRKKAEDRVDHAVGIARLIKVGQRVSQGEVLAEIHANDETKAVEAESRLKVAITIGEKRADPNPRVVDIV